jgi:hypothetical protein
VEFSGRCFEWTFLLAKVNFAILGADFLKHFNLIVDLVANQIVDAVSLQLFAAGPPAGINAPPASKSIFSRALKWHSLRSCQLRAQKVSIFRVHPFQCPS